MALRVLATASVVALVSVGSARAGPASTPPFAPCPRAVSDLRQILIDDRGGEWVLCAGQGAAGSMAKAVYRLTRAGWVRVAWTPLGGRGYGGIGLYGYPLGLAMAHDGFGLIWESRGTLYVTRNGGVRWHALPQVARPEVDFGVSGSVQPHGIGFALLMRGNEHRLVATRDWGRTWLVRRRWR